jgi:hypothetical protein
MPRKAKTPAAPYPTGSPPAGQPARAPTGMPYGAHEASIGAQRSMPVAGPAANTPTAPSGPAAAGGPPPPITDEQVMNAARQAKFAPVPLTAAPDRPEPLSSGLPMGAGPGPAALPSARPVAADTLEMIAVATGDALFADLAERARLRRAP